MHDYLKDAAVAASMTDMELIDVWRQVEDRENLTAEQEAILDEMKRRGIDPR